MEREGNRLLFGVSAANWSNFASQTIVYHPRGGLTCIFHPTRIKEGVTRDFMGDQANYVAQISQSLFLYEERSYSFLRRVSLLDI